MSPEKRNKFIEDATLLLIDQIINLRKSDLEYVKTCAKTLKEIIEKENNNEN